VPVVRHVIQRAVLVVALRKMQLVPTDAAVTSPPVR